MTKTLITLTIEVDEAVGYDAEAWATDFADEVRNRLSANGVPGEIILTTNDGVFEYH